MAKEIKKGGKNRLSLPDNQVVIAAMQTMRVCFFQRITF